MRDPLLGPVAAIAAGILAARFVPFRMRRVDAGHRRFSGARRRRHACAARACWPASAACWAWWRRARSRPWRTGRARRPNWTSTGREVVILSGCVVEPPALSGERERFLLELEPHARVQVTLYAKPDEALPALAYGRNIELDARVRSPRNYENPGAFDYRHYLARHDIYWTASGAAGTVRVLPGRCGSRFQKAVMDLRAAAMARIDSLYRARSLPGRHDAGGAAGAAVSDAKSVDRRLPLHRHLSHAGDLRNPCGHRGGFRLFRLAAVLRSGEPGRGADRGGGVALRADHRVQRAVRAVGRGADAGDCGRLFLPPEAPLEPAGRRGARFSAASIRISCSMPASS